jgi:acyl-CoA thioester hydrolase
VPGIPDDTTFDHVIDFTVRFGDLDPLKHLNNVAVVTMFETARVEFTNDLGLIGGAATGFVLVSLHVDYRAQGYYRDTLALGTGVARIGRTSFTLRHRLWRTTDDATIAEGEGVLVVLGDDRKTPVPVPESWRTLLSSGPGSGPGGGSRPSGGSGGGSGPSGDGPPQT